MAKKSSSQTVNVYRRPGIIHMLGMILTLENPTKNPPMSYDEISKKMRVDHLWKIQLLTMAAMAHISSKETKHHTDIASYR
jgi:hypothetical protein